MSGYENPAERAMRNIDRERRSPEYLHPIIIEAYEKARHLIEEDAIDPQSFIHPYGVTAVQNDIALAKRLQDRYEKKNEPHKKYADVIETILF